VAGGRLIAQTLVVEALDAGGAEALACARRQGRHQSVS
jgi:hypothetical protein